QLHRFVAGDFAYGFLDGAFDFMGDALDAILVHDGVLLEKTRLAKTGLKNRPDRRVRQEKPRGFSGPECERASQVVSNYDRPAPAFAVLNHPVTGREQKKADGQALYLPLAASRSLSGFPSCSKLSPSCSPCTYPGASCSFCLCGPG